MWGPGGYPYGVLRPAPWTPRMDVVCERFCAACECSQKTREQEPCWNCGGETTPTRPAFWPVCGSQQHVTAGNTWGVDELEDFSGTTICATTGD